ncbi:cytochrome oxidase subunit III [Halomonas sp. TRM85114]|uniref:cytochrome oxidase subunit III n=1 Tax=Halomonas jincaotanensis TaxID=2810616 RepID=UPI001BD63D89|nr:cytochrome oxidase subunit III [Halomonas jincaotanensis]MBS9404087.1 cytochrome oxidase subunit III [Halomonas jincaotanensis]
MTVSLILIVAMMAALVGWLLRQSIAERPWVAASGPQSAPLPAGFTAPRVGLLAFLAVVTSVFALTVSAYLMRMEMGADWRSMPVPGLLWANSTALVLASLALQLAWRAAARDQARRLRQLLAAGGGFTLAFLAGQLLAWQQLEAAGYYLVANPANAFFYLLTALHGAHLLGGLMAWTRVLARLHGNADAAWLCAGVELCALYWHFLLLVWALLFGLLLTT